MGDHDGGDGSNAIDDQVAREHLEAVLVRESRRAMGAVA